MREKKTRGKQKINIRRVEKDEDRMVTFSKRRSGIYTKLTELSILCGADVGFLVYSGAGKPYTVGTPSLEAVADRFLNGREINNRQGSSSSSSSSIIEAHRRVKIEELCKSYNKLVDDLDMEEERVKTAVADMEKNYLTVESGEAWWKDEAKEDDEEARRLLERFVEFHEKLCDVADAKING